MLCKLKQYINFQHGYAANFLVFFLPPSFQTTVLLLHVGKEKAGSWFSSYKQNPVDKLNFFSLLMNCSQSPEVLSAQLGHWVETRSKANLHDFPTGGVWSRTQIQYLFCCLHILLISILVVEHAPPMDVLCPSYRDAHFAQGFRIILFTSSHRVISSHL